MPFFIPASELHVGDVIAPTKTHSLLNVKEVSHKKEPRTRQPYVVVRGPLGKTLTFAADDPVKMIRHT